MSSNGGDAEPNGQATSNNEVVQKKVEKQPNGVTARDAAKPDAKQKEAPKESSKDAPAGGKKKEKTFAAGDVPPKHDKKAAGNNVPLSAPVPMSRSRSTPESTSPHASPSLSGQANPHPPASGSFSPQAPIPLPHPWSMYLDDTNLWGVKNIEECLARMGYLGTVDSIQAFWSYWNAMEKKLLTERKLGALSCQGSITSSGALASPPASSPTAGSGGNGRYNWRIFDSVVTPVWEDESHVNGGKYVLRCGHGELRATKWIWTKLVLSMIGGQFVHQDLVCGCVLACRPHKKEIQIWVKHTPPKLKEQRVLPLPPGEESARESPSVETAATTTTNSSNSSSPGSSPSSSPPSTSPTPPTQNPPKHAICTCHIDPVVCLANDIRFLLGVPLMLPGSNTPVIKIEYISHEETMRDVAARNSRLKSKQKGRSSSTAGEEKLSAKELEKRKQERAREERNKQRDKDVKIMNETKIQQILAEKRGDRSGGAGPTPSPLSSPTPDGPKFSPKPLPSPPGGISFPGRKQSTWADASEDGGELDLGIESSDYATSTASSAQSTPIHSGQMPSRTLAGSRPGRKVSSGSMLRQSSDPTSEANAIQQHLDALAKNDTRTFEGVIGDAALQGRGPPTIGGLLLQSPAALELQKKNKGQTPLKLSGERSYHPEPDSPGFNGTPVPSPSTTPLGFYDGSGSGGTTPTPRSPFTAHSPRNRQDRTRADSAGGSRLHSARGGIRVGPGSGTYPPGASPDSASSSYDNYPDDSSDLEDEQGMLQYDALSPSYERGREHGFQLDRTRDLLRVPLDLEQLSLPPAGRQPQRIRDPGAAPVRAGAGGESILSLVGPSKGEVVQPHAVKPGDHMAKLIVAAQGQRVASDHRAAEVGGEGGPSAFVPASSHEHTPVQSRRSSNANREEQQQEQAARGANSRKKSSAQQLSQFQQQQQQKKKNKLKTEESAVARRAKPKTMKFYVTWALVAALAAVLIYFLFFTTLAPEPEPYLFPEKTISEKGSKIKMPKVQSK